MVSYQSLEGPEVLSPTRKIINPRGEESVAPIHVPIMDAEAFFAEGGVYLYHLSGPVFRLFAMACT